MAKALRKALGGVVEYDDDDTPWDIRSFNEFGKSPLLWLEQSRALHRAAVALMAQDQGPSVRRLVRAPIALMLGGFAVEVLFKMVIVGNYCDEHGVAWNSRKAKEFVPAVHGLQKLLGSAKLRTSKADRETLGHLERYAVWAGRYPIPLMAAGYDRPALFEMASPGGQPDVHPIWKRYQPLYEKLHRLAVRRTFKDQISPIKRGLI